METKKSCSIIASNYIVDGYKYLHDGDSIHLEFDGEAAEFLNRMLPLLKESEYEKISDLALSYFVLPF